ncbi:MAG: MFS transporter [Pseudohongiella sp.]|nr:MFS transporter [Pseudohongiella sp.]MDO9519308.1 MFS transporter [Pseudohongiella sp.]MDP2126090.1 MFS transporter [Pseudohongiella sp.]
MISYLSFIRQQWTLLVFGFLAVFAGNFGQSFFVAWFGSDIQRSLGLSAAEYGSAYSLGTLVSAFVVLWAGGLIDRVSLRSYTLAVVAGLGAAMLLLSQADGLLMLMAGFFLLRLFGQSLLPHTGMTTLTRYFDEQRGKAVSVAMSAVPIGEIVLPLLAVSLIAALGWQQTFLWLAFIVPLLLVPLFLALLVRADHTADVAQAEQTAAPADGLTGAVPDDEDFAAGRREVLLDYRYWLALPGIVANPFLITGIFIHQNFLASSKDWSLNWLATCFVVYGAVHWISSLVSGALVDRFKPVRLLPVFLLPLLVCMLVAAYVPGDWAAVLMMVCLGMSAGSSPPISGSLWPEIYGTRKLGAIRAMNMSVMVISTSAAPVLFGYFIDNGVSAAGLFGSCALYVFVALVLMNLSYPLNARPLRQRPAG